MSRGQNDAVMEFGPERWDILKEVYRFAIIHKTEEAGDALRHDIHHSKRDRRQTQINRYSAEYRLTSARPDFKFFYAWGD